VFSDLCPKCGAEIIDTDGVNLMEDKGEVKCWECGTTYEYRKIFKDSPDNPYCDEEWVKTEYIVKDVRDV